MKFYHKYKTELEAAGYRVDENGYVWDAMGNQSAGEDIYGNVQSKDPNVTEVCRLADMVVPTKKAPKKTKAKKEKAVGTSSKMVRARDENGHFIADDPSTPDVNEAWVSK
tara:strand:+ start:102 stop:431 length:330 start_codon:yes stop_codon:yes gene_type:complete